MYGLCLKNINSFPSSFFLYFDIYSDIKFIQIFQNFMAVAQACTEKSCFVWDNKRVEQHFAYKTYCYIIIIFISSLQHNMPL